MLYMWVRPECPNKHVAEDHRRSPDTSLLRKGVQLSVEEFNQCDCYVRSTELLDLLDDPFIRMQLRRTHRAAYIFTPEQLFYCDSFLVTKVKIDSENLRKLKIALSLTDMDADKYPKALSDEELDIISTFKECPQFSRIPILSLKASTFEIQKKYDVIPNNIHLPLVNTKVVDLLMKLLKYIVRTAS